MDTILICLFFNILSVFQQGSDDNSDLVPLFFQLKHHVVVILLGSLNFLPQLFLCLVKKGQKHVKVFDLLFICSSLIKI